MRNLSLSSCFNTGGDAVEASLASCSAMTVDSLTPCVFFGCTDSIAVLNSGRISSKIDISELKMIDDPFVTFDYLPDEMLLCFSLASGSIVTVEPTSSTVELVGAVAGGIVAGAWSPDLELLVLVGGEERNLLMMTRTFDQLGEYPIETDSFGQDQLMTIGWGSKETQFQGTIGKQAATAKAETASSTNAWDEGRITISWRGDGQYFAVCSVSPARNCRVVRVWTREGVHSSTCDALPGMEHSLSWKPSGSLIATSVHRQNAHEVVFFERNGQKRSQFDVRSPTAERSVVQLLWNIDSTVLAVHSKSLTASDHTVQLWTVSNYHWHLKYTHSIAREDRLSAVMWDPETALDLHIVLGSGRYLRLSFCWSVDVSPHDLATVAVIDGAAIRVTPFGKFVIPPPMAKFSVATPSPVNQVVWSGDGRLAALLHDNSIATFSFTNDGYKSEQVVEAENLPGDAVIYRIAWNGGDQLTGILAKINWTLVSITLNDKTWRTQDTLHSSEVPIIAHCGVKDGHYLQLANGDWLEKRGNSSDSFRPMMEDGETVKFRSPNCFSSTVVVVGEVAKAIGLASTYQLYVNNKEVATNVNSFAVHDQFLLVTTLTHQLHCMELNSLVAAGQLKLGAGRAVERGSRLVCACGKSTRVILQMPRGNLEAIDPRPLVLHSLKRFIDDRQYLDALMCMKRHRINMNLLYDHDPKRLTENMAEFVEKISDPLLLNLFLMDLVDEDTTRSMYADFYTKEVEEGKATLATAGKVDRVCRLVREALDRLPADEQRRRLTAILTTYAKLSRPEVDHALLRVKQVAAQAASGDATAIVDDALRYLLYIVHAETLFNMALATYDLDLVLMVAERSQKDPKEYLPLLNKLRRMDPSYMKFTIEMHLERFSNALTQIAQCSEDHFPEAVDLIKKHQLFRESLQVFANSEKYPTICSLYADHCNQKRQFAEAALLYQSAGESDKAFEAYSDGLYWRELITLAKQIGMDEERLTDTLKHVAAKLENNKRFEEAAQIYEQYLKTVNNAVTCYCSAGNWAKALCVVASSGQADLTESIVSPALKSRAEFLIESAQRWSAELNTHCERLRIVRANKTSRLLTWVESGEPDFAESEVFSEASTAISGTTSSSLRSGQSMSSSKRTRGKHLERKKAMLKEGSRYEDLARMGAIRQIIIDIDAAQDDLGPLLTALVRLRMNEQAAKVQRDFSTLIAAARALLTDVWPAFWQAHLLPGPLEELYKGADGIIRFPTAGAMPDRIAIEPQMNPPTIRPNVFWELDMLKQL